MPVSEVHGGNDGVSELECVGGLIRMIWCLRARSCEDLMCWRCAHAHLRLTGSEASLEPQQTPARLYRNVEST